MNKVSVIITYYNRCEKTERCIQQLIKSAEKSKDLQIAFFVCDDGSTDGTTESIKKICQQNSVELHVTEGSGNLFWARGMAAAMEEAEKYPADFYLMVNDDVDFFDDAIQNMLDAYAQITNKKSAVVGSTKDSVTGVHTYGGEYWEFHGIKDSTRQVKPCNPIQKCNRANWNCFLLPVKLYDEIGKIDTYYEHGAADFDYTKRIVDAGYEVFVADKYIGLCSRNEKKGTWNDPDLSMLRRIKAMNKKNGLPPKSQWYFCKKMYGKYAIWYFVRPYLSIMKNSLAKVLKKKKI